MHDEVLNIIAQSLGIDPRDIDETSTLGQDLGLSAADIAEIVTTVNLKYETEIDPDEAAQAKTVEELFETIGKYVPEDLE
ncbi:MAG: hypothetical protein G01um10145_633 [Microgenomates group bacterium Gr01-1014_5]|nr:MAG: hypothetical protein G01um10145_633 [Microgenomates group bacterium Gr01-1014_5]